MEHAERAASASLGGQGVTSLSGRKTELEPAIRALPTLRIRDGGLDLLRRAA